jgi:D-arabinose 1-dehydrogenase-like Zn-dependent alcohol dehydrogenase
MDSQDTMSFSALTGIRPMVETMPLDRAAEAYERMMGGKARFRMVLTTGL